MLRSLLLVTSIVSAVPALAQDIASPSAPAKPVKEKRVCRRQADLGSNIPHSTCHTVSEWAQIDQANRISAAQTVATGRQSGH